MLLNKIRNLFCVLDTKFVSATNVARAGKLGNIILCRQQCDGNNVSSFARALKKDIGAILIRKLKDSEVFNFFFIKERFCKSS